jgi:hypothetical protein
MYIKNQEKIPKNNLHHTEKTPFSLFLKFFKNWTNHSYFYYFLKKLGIDIEITLHQYTFEFSFLTRKKIFQHIPNFVKEILFFFFRYYIFYHFAAYIHKKNLFNYLFITLINYFKMQYFLFLLKRISFFIFTEEIRENNLYFNLPFPFTHTLKKLILRNFHSEILFYPTNLYHYNQILKGFYIPLNNINFFLTQLKYKKLYLKKFIFIYRICFPSNLYNKENFRNLLFFYIGTKIFIYEVQIQFSANKIYQITKPFTGYFIPLKSIQIQSKNTIPINQFYVRSKIENDNIKF